MKRIYFYATKNDLLPALAAMEADCSVKYGAAGMSLQPVVQQWRQGSELPNLGTANGNQQVTCDAFLIFSADSELGIRSSVMFDGRTRYDVDQISHPESVVSCPSRSPTRSCARRPVFFHRILDSHPPGIGKTARSSRAVSRPYQIRFLHRKSCARCWRLCGNRSLPLGVLGLDVRHYPPFGKACA